MTSELTGGAAMLLGWVPFIEPIPAHGAWAWPWLLIPLALAISIVYKTLKLEDLRKLPQAAAWMTVQIVAFMVAAALVLWGLTELY